MIERLALLLFHPSIGPVSLWQALFIGSCILAAGNLFRLLRPLRKDTLVLLAAIVAAGGAARLALSPRNLLLTTYRGQAQIASAAFPLGFLKAATPEETREADGYYLGYGHEEYLRMLLRVSPGDSPAARAFTADGAASCLQSLLVFVLALLLFRDERTALWCAVLEGFSPAAIRLAFGDSVYGFGAVPMLLALIHALLFMDSRSYRALLPALGFTVCTVGTHAAFLPVPFVALVFGLAHRHGPGAPEPRPIRTWVFAASLFLLTAPAFLVYQSVYTRSLADIYGLGSRPLGYAREVLEFLFSRRNPLLDPRFDSPLIHLLLAGGCAALALRRPRVLVALCAAVVLLEVPVVFVSGSVNAALVKHGHILSFYLLIAGYGAAAGIALLRRPAHRMAVSGLLAAAVVLLPVPRRTAIGQEHNLQREFSFLRQALREGLPDEEIFTFGNAAGLIGILRPARGAPNGEASEHRQPRWDDPASLEYLDCLLAAGRQPLAYLSLSCYPQTWATSPDGDEMHAACRRTLGRYRLQPVAELRFTSDPYCPETDSTRARELAIGFHRIVGRGGDASGVRYPGSAAQACRRLRDRIPSLGTPYGALLSMLERRTSSGDARSALTLAREAVRRFPSDAVFRLFLARAFDLQGDRASALLQLAQARALSGTTQLLRDIAMQYQRFGEYRSAREILEALAAEAPRDASLLNDLGVCEYLAHAPDRALRTLTRAIRLDPRLIPAHRTLAALHAEAGRSREAREALRRARALQDPL